MTSLTLLDVLSRFSLKVLKKGFFTSFFDLISSEGGRLVLKNDSLNYLSQLKEEVVLVTLLSSTDDQNPLNQVKLSLLSNMINLNVQDSNNRGATFYTSKLRKENSGASVLFCNMKSSNNHLLSLLFLSSSLFIFCVNGGINDNELANFLNINNLPSTIELQQRSNRELIFTESSPKCIFFISNSQSNLNTFPKDYLDTELRKKSNNPQINLVKENSINSEKINQQLLNQHYAIINQKIMNGQYNSNNTDEYLRDYETFINKYKSEAKGNNKLKCLIDFLEVNKPNYFKSLVGSIEKQNQGLLLEANKKLEDSKKKKKRARREI